VAEEFFDDFENGMNEVAQEWLDAATLTRRMETDGPLAAEYRRVDLVDALHKEVWGKGFAAPTFSEEVEVVSQRLVPRVGGKGRVSAVEVLLNSSTVASLIQKGEVVDVKEVMKKSREMGMQTFDQALFDLYEAGEISYQDALRNADSINDLRLQIKLKSKDTRDADLSAGTEHLSIV
jgi:hypothetical protein